MTLRDSLRRRASARNVSFRISFHQVLGKVLGVVAPTSFPGPYPLGCCRACSQLTLQRISQRMSVLPSRIFFQPAIVHVFSAFPMRFSLRWYPTITRQEFGRHFEELVVHSLRKYSFDVAVCGGPKDRGIDFRGVWQLRASSVPVIGQCRRYQKRLGPKHVRELVGTLTHEAKGTLGIIVTECGWVFCRKFDQRTIHLNEDPKRKSVLKSLCAHSDHHCRGECMMHRQQQVFLLLPRWDGNPLQGHLPVL